MNRCRRRIAIAAAIFLPSFPAFAQTSAQTRPSVAEAEVLFADAKTLRDAGKYPEACAKFAASEKLAPGVGVSLYLADCYEHVGRTASAWASFRAAEERAIERKDERSTIASARARALEAKLTRVKVVLAPSLHRVGVEVWLDDSGALPPASFGSGVAADPGEHVVTLRLGGRIAQRRIVPVAAGGGVTSVVLAEPPLSASVLRVPFAHPEAPESHDAALEPRVAVELGLVGLGVVSAGAGAGLLVAKNGSLSDGAPNGHPSSDQGASVASTAAFAIAGAAIVSAVVLYLTAPDHKEGVAAVTFAPVPLPGGGGGFVQARF
jgi:hypothetical protein